MNQSWLVDIDAMLDKETGQIDWIFRTLDSATLDLPCNALEGFLPPNDDFAWGDGHMSFTIFPKPDAGHGTAILNSADIIFDTNLSIATNEIRNVIGVFELMNVLDQWLVGGLCDEQNRRILKYTQFVNDGFTCPLIRSAWFN